MTEPFNKPPVHWSTRTKARRTQYLQASHEARELRTCILCEEFLDDDDPGQDLVHSEDCDVYAVVCLRCRITNTRI